MGELLAFRPVNFGWSGCLGQRRGGSPGALVWPSDARRVSGIGWKPEHGYKRHGTTPVEASKDNGFPPQWFNPNPGCHRSSRWRSVCLPASGDAERFASGTYRVPRGRVEISCKPHRETAQTSSSPRKQVRPRAKQVRPKERSRVAPLAYAKRRDAISHGLPYRIQQHPPRFAAGLPCS